MKLRVFKKLRHDSQTRGTDVNTDHGFLWALLSQHLQISSYYIKVCEATGPLLSRSDPEEFHQRSQN